MKRMRRILAAVLLFSLGAAVPSALAYHSSDYASSDWSINLSELLRAIQFYNVGQYSCDPSGEDGYAPGPGDHSCLAHDGDYSSQDWSISLSELLRLIQFYNVGMYHVDLAGEDGYAPGPPDTEAPTAVLDAPVTATYGRDFTLSGTRSSDAGGGTVVTYRWTALDSSGGGLAQGVPVETATPTLTVTAGTDPVPLGVWTYRLVVVDGSGNESLPSDQVVNVELPTCLGRYLTVTSDTDAADADVGDEVCDDGAGNCTLRAAVQEANACPGPDVIKAPTGTYYLTIGGQNENAAATGDLDIADELTVDGAGAATTIIDGNGLDRVFHGIGSAPVTLTGLTIQNGSVSGSSGGGIAVNILTLRDAVVTNNQALGDVCGGGVSSSGTLVIVRTSVTENTVGAGGGGVCVGTGGAATLVDSTVSRNGANYGGGIVIYNQSSLDVSRSTIALNSAATPDYGGGIVAWTSSQPAATITLENSTLAGNTGTGLTTLAGSRVDVTNSTISQNSRSGIYVSGGAVTLTNSILYRNGPNCSLNGGTITSGGHNLDSANTCGFGSAGDLVDTDPMLGALAENGGPTRTQGPLAGSPVPDAGDNAACPAVDQRGTPRDDGACDIGAVEGAVEFIPCLGGAVAVDSTADAVDADVGDGLCDDGAGNCTLRAAVQEASACPGGDVIDVGAGTYVLTLGQLVLAEEVTVRGAGASSTVVDGNAASRVFAVSGTAFAVTFEDLTIRNGNVAGSGAGVATSAPLTTFRNTVITRNTSTGDSYGGGVVAWGAMTVFENAEISHNKAHYAAIAFGNNTLVLRNSTVSYNRGDNWPYHVGGIIDYSTAPSSLAIENSTIAGNEGRALLLHGAQATITNSTISGNQREGIRVEPNSSVTVTNSILHGNGPNCSVNGGTLASGGHNIDGANTCGFAADGDLVNTTPMLGPLADNGGPTPTMGLLTASPALDAGDNALCPATDQRGVLRDDGACDIGAVEGAFPFATCLGGNVAVDSTADVVDADIGDGICDDGVGNCTLRAAIQETNACLGPDVIDLPAGTYLLAVAGANENASVTGDLDVTDDLTIHGAGMVATIIDGNGAVLNDRVFQVLNGVTTAFDGLTIQNGNTSSSGGGIDTTGDLTLSNASVSGNTASGHGGGVCNWGAGSTVTIADSVLSNNTSGGSGGALLVAGEVNVSGSTLAGNTLPFSYGHNGAAVYGHLGARINISGNTLIDNNSAGYAEAVWGHENSTVNITDSTVSNSQSGTRGVVGWSNSIVNISRSTISGNEGGGVSSTGNPGTGSVLNIANSTIAGNAVSAPGAGVYSAGLVTIRNSTISGNSIPSAYGSSFTGQNGAGLCAAGTGSIINSTFSGNVTSSTNATAGNLGCGGIVTVTNSIFWGGSPYNCAGVTIVSGGHNIDSANTCGFDDAGDLIDTDPLLGALADNGGPTWTRALQDGSPAIDAGADAVCAAAPVDGVDQRGVARPQGTHCDIGAYEYP